jgi:hypothetical protein
MIVMGFVSDVARSFDLMTALLVRLRREDGRSDGEFKNWSAIGSASTIVLLQGMLLLLVAQWELLAK